MENKDFVDEGPSHDARDEDYDTKYSEEEGRPRRDKGKKLPKRVREEEDKEPEQGLPLDDKGKKTPKRVRKEEDKESEQDLPLGDEGKKLPKRGLPLDDKGKKTPKRDIFIVRRAAKRKPKQGDMREEIDCGLEEYYHERDEKQKNLRRAAKSSHKSNEEDEQYEEYLRETSMEPQAGSSEKSKNGKQDRGEKKRMDVQEFTSCKLNTTTYFTSF